MASILLGLFGMTVYSAGVILQKKGSVWMNWRYKKNNKFISMLGLWFVGVLFSYVISTIPIGAASKGLPAFIVSALSGWSILVIVYLSSVFLKEKMYFSDVIYSLAIITCIVLLSLNAKVDDMFELKHEKLYYLLFVPFLLLVPVFFKSMQNKHKTILLSIFSGILGGMTIVFMNILVKDSGGSISEIAASPYIYIYFTAGIASNVAIQAAYRYGDVILVTPLQTSLSIMYPILCSVYLLNSSISVVQLLSVFIIVICCWGILKRR